MAASRKWKQNVAGSRKIVKRAIKSPVQRKIPRKRLSALRSFITNSNPNQYFWRSHAKTLAIPTQRRANVGEEIVLRLDRRNYVDARRLREFESLQLSQRAAGKANTGGCYRQPATQIKGRQDVSRSVAARGVGKVLAIAKRLPAAASGG